MKIKSKFLKIGLLLIIIFLTFSFYLFLELHQAKKKIFIGSSVATKSLPVVNKSIADYFKNQSSFNILLLGYGGGNHEGAYLTDSMIVMHIDPSDKKIVLISIPRDIWIEIPTNGDKGSYWKINAAYELGLDDIDYPKKKDQFKGVSGGGNLTKYIVGEVTGFNIDRFIALDFSGFKKTISTLRGVDINVEKAFDDYQFPIDGKEDDLCGHTKEDLPDLEKIATISATEAFPCRYKYLHFDAGLIHMGGEAALDYVRSRHSLQDGTDFGRSKRQRNLLIAIKQKIFNLGFIPQILPFMTSLQDDIRTDLSLLELKTFIDKADDLNQYQFSNLALSDENVLKWSFTDDGQYILSPKDGLDVWDSTQSFISSAILGNKPILSPTIKVENGTNIAGLATLAANRLQDKDFNVLPSGNSDVRVTATTVTIFNNQIDPKVIDDLKKEFNVKEVEFKPQTDLSYDVVVLLGDDYNQSRGKKLIN